MNRYISFLKKEFNEMVRNYKLLILLCVFFLLGIMSPITAKYTPELLEKFMQDGITISITEPTAMDSWMQFFKNVNLLGIVVIVVVFSGILSNEFSKGTLINMITKGISRKTILFSKFTAVFISWTVFFFFTFVLSYGYTKYFWDDSISNVLFSVCAVWIFGIMVISQLFLGSLLFKSNYGSLFLPLIIVILLFVINIVPEIAKYNPMMLVSSNMDLLKGTKEVSDFIKPIIVSLIVTIFNLITSTRLFDKKIL